MLGECSFKKYDQEKHKNSGAVLVGAYEAIIAGLTPEVTFYEQHTDVLRNKLEQLYVQDAYCKAIKRGTRPVSRMKQLIAFGRKYFQNHES